jgi:hypothetical protein
MRIAIVGLGPAGLACAARLVERRPSPDAFDLVLLERKSRPGRKLLVSGSGACNVTHSGDSRSLPERYGHAARFLAPALLSFTNRDLVAFLESRGIPCEEDANGKVFPASRRASDVLDALLSAVDAPGVAIATDSRVIRIGHEPGLTDRPAFAAEVGGGILRFDALVLATGGASYPATGSSGDGYELAAALGHEIVPPRPALAPLYVDGFELADLAGVSFEGAGLSVRRSGERIFPPGKHRLARGDLLITHRGFSGPLILDASRDVRLGDDIEIDFTGTDAEGCRKALSDAIARAPKALVATALADCDLPRRLPRRLAAAIAAASGAEGSTCATLRREARDKAVALACAWPFRVSSLGSWDEAMATAGGVSLDEVDRRTMESKLVPGLYFAGEVLDVDGPTGGYNIQAAFSTGTLAADALLGTIAHE